MLASNNCTNKSIPYSVLSASGSILASLKPMGKGVRGIPLQFSDSSLADGPSQSIPKPFAPSYRKERWNGLGEGRGKDRGGGGAGGGLGGGGGGGGCLMM